MFISFLDITGLIFGVLGAIYVGNVKRVGFLFFVIGSLAHGLMGYLQGNLGLAITAFIFICIDIYYYNKWERFDV